LRHVLAAALSVLACFVSPAEASEAAPTRLPLPAISAGLRDRLAEMVRQWSLNGNAGERAAFIVADANGIQQLVHWNDERNARRSSFRGPLPPNVIAIVHTHPHALSHLPSNRDCREAHRLKLPIYVITRRGIWAADVSGEVVMVLRDQRWTSREVAAEH
jgi:hypothetical protein